MDFSRICALVERAISTKCSFWVCTVQLWLYSCADWCYLLDLHTHLQQKIPPIKRANYRRTKQIVTDILDHCQGKVENSACQKEKKLSENVTIFTTSTTKNDWCFRPRFCTWKVILVCRQPGLILTTRPWHHNTWIFNDMPYYQFNDHVFFSFWLPNELWPTDPDNGQSSCVLVMGHKYRLETTSIGPYV